jgi:hypothetical protein
MPDFNVFADESRLNGDRHMLIGGLWVPTELDGPLRSDINGWRDTTNMTGEMKWTKVSNGKLAEYQGFTDLFFAHARVGFHCIVLDTKVIDHLAYSDGDSELGFYKFYFQLLSRRVRKGNRYTIFTDHRTTRKDTRLADLGRCVNNWCAGHATPGERPVLDVRPCDSKCEDMVQLVDVLLGAVGYQCNGRSESASKMALIGHLEEKLHRRLSSPTPPYFRKLNVWHWSPRAAGVK